MDLIQTIEDKPIALFEMQGLLSKLNKQETLDSIVDFVMDFEPFLRQTVEVGVRHFP